MKLTPVVHFYKHFIRVAYSPSKIGATTLSIMTFSIMTLSITTIIIMTLSITTIIIMTLSITINKM